MRQETLRALLVEDDEAMRAFAERALQGAGFAVESAANGLDALKRLRHADASFDVLVLDLVLPWMNGLELLAEIRGDAATRALPVLITTGTLVFDVQLSGLAPVAALRKPFDATQLVVAVESLLYRRVS